jgi:hypothetical protein
VVWSEAIGSTQEIGLTDSEHTGSVALGQTDGQSVFVMTVPGPGAASMLCVVGLIGARRRRW